MSGILASDYEAVDQMTLCNVPPLDSEDFSAENASITEEDHSLTEEDSDISSSDTLEMKIESNDDVVHSFASQVPSQPNEPYKKFPKIRSIGEWDHSVHCMCPECNVYRFQQASISQEGYSPICSPHLQQPTQHAPYRANTPSPPFAAVQSVLPLSPGRAQGRKSSPRQHAQHMGGVYEEKPYVCQYCAKKFSTSRYLEVHLRIHTGEKPFGCADCGKRFTQEIHLTTHRRTHSDEKPYICLECGKGFSQPNNLRTHRRIHLEEKPFSCPNPDCKKKFSDQSNYKRHLRTSGHGGPTPTQYQQANLVVYDGVRYVQ